MFILSKEDFYTIALRKHRMNRGLEKLMAAEQLDIDAIREELEKHPRNGTNPYIIWDRFMYECTKVGCTTSDTDINLPTFFLKNGHELEYDLVANMHWTYIGDSRFESRFSFWLGKLSYKKKFYGYGFETNHDYAEGYTKGVCGKSLGTDCAYYITNTSQTQYFIQNFWNYVACVADVVKRAHEHVNRENKKLIKEAGNAYTA